MTNFPPVPPNLGVSRDFRLFLEKVQRELSAIGRSYAVTIGDGGTAYTVAHNLGSRDVLVDIYKVADGTAAVSHAITRTDANTLGIAFDSAISADSHRVVVRK